MAAPLQHHTRLRLFIFGNETRKYWYLLDHERTPKISNVIKDIQKKFTDGNEVELQLMDCMVPPFEESTVLRDNDEVVVLPVKKATKEAIPQDSGDHSTVTVSGQAEASQGVPVEDEDLCKTLEITVVKSSKKHKKKQKRKHDSVSLADDNEISTTKSKVHKLSSKPSGEDETASELNSSTVCYVNDSKTEKKQSDVEKSISVKSTSVDVFVSPEPMATNQTESLNTTDTSRVEGSTKRKRIRKRKRTRKDQNSSLTDSSTVNNSSSLSTNASENIPTAKKHRMKKTPKAFRNQHVRFSSESDSDEEEEEEVLCSTLMPEVPIPSGTTDHTDEANTRNTEGPPKAPNAGNVYNTVTNGKQNNQRAYLTVSDTVLEAMSPILVVNPAKLEKKVMRNGAAVFIRPRRGQPPVRELSKEEQLNSTATNKSVILRNNLPVKQPTTERHAINGQAPVAMETDLLTNGQAQRHPPFFVDPVKYSPLVGHPRLGDVIAYKILELSEDYTPELSDFKVNTLPVILTVAFRSVNPHESLKALNIAKDCNSSVAVVLQFDNSTQTVSLHILSGIKAKTEPGKFDLDVEEDSTLVTLQWSLLQNTLLLPKEVADQLKCRKELTGEQVKPVLA